VPSKRPISLLMVHIFGDAAIWPSIRRVNSKGLPLPAKVGSAPHLVSAEVLGEKECTRAGGLVSGTRPWENQKGHPTWLANDGKGEKPFIFLVTGLSILNVSDTSKAE